MRCKATAYTLQDSTEVIEVRGVYSDPPDPFGVQIAKITASLKRRCEENDENPMTVISSSLSTATTATVGRLPSTQTMARRINRHRNNISGAPADPPSRGLLVILESYLKYGKQPGAHENFQVSDGRSRRSPEDHNLRRKVHELMDWLGRGVVCGRNLQFDSSPVLPGISQFHSDRHILLIPNNEANIWTIAHCFHSCLLYSPSVQDASSQSPTH